MTDSQFTINCITKWIHKWKRDGWKLSGSGGDVKNREDLEKLDRAMQGMEIKWVRNLFRDGSLSLKCFPTNCIVRILDSQSYVPGHRGYHGNEQADQLAVAGASKRRK